LIQNLYQQDFSSVQISRFLNANKILSPTGLQYDPKLVWVSNDKFQKRRKRIAEKVVSIGQDYFFINEGLEFLEE
jgi:DNA recombination-dependent growth factor C